MIGLLSADELPKTILERQDFIDYFTSHRIDSIVLELKNRTANFCEATAIRFLGDLTSATRQSQWDPWLSPPAPSLKQWTPHLLRRAGVPRLLVVWLYREI